VEIEGFELTADGEANDGHVDFSLNGQGVAMVADLAFELPEVAEGTYVLRAELVTPDHLPLDPPSYDESTFECAPSACGVER